MITLHPADGARPARLQLAGELTVAQAADTRGTLLQLWPQLSAGALDIDLAEVDTADTAAVQLLLALGHGLRAQGVAARVVACSAALNTVGQALGAIDTAHCFGLAAALPTGAPD